MDIFEQPMASGESYLPGLGAGGEIAGNIMGPSPFNQFLDNYINSQSGVLGMIPGMPTWAKALGSMKMGFSSGGSSFGINMGGGGGGAGGMAPQVMSAMQGMMNQGGGLGQPVTISNSRTQTNPTSGTPMIDASRFMPGIGDMSRKLMDNYGGQWES